MRVLAMASQKGGSGKTTLAGHLAVQAERAGHGPVVLLDLDPQANLSDWWDDRGGDRPAFAQTSATRLSADLEVLRQQGFKLAMIDTPPGNAMVTQGVIHVAELVVVPVRPSPHDVRAAAATVDLCQRAGKPLVFVLNGATPDAPLNAETTVALSHHGSVAPVTIHQRPDYAAAMIDGGTVVEGDPDGEPAGEIAQLWTHICGRLEKNFRRTVFSVPTVNGGGFGARPTTGGFGRRVTAG